MHAFIVVGYVVKSSLSKLRYMIIWNELEKNLYGMYKINTFFLVWVEVFFGAGLEAGALGLPELGFAEVSFFTCPAEWGDFSTGFSALSDAILHYSSKQTLLLASGFNTAPYINL